MEHKMGIIAWIVLGAIAGYIAGFLLFYSVGAHVASLRAMLATTAAGLVLSVIGALTHTSTWVDYINVVTVVIGPVAVGRFVRHQREQSARLRELTLHLERERERSAGLAVAEERARIARELHDVVAHDVSVMLVQAAAAKRTVPADPERARAAIAAVEETGRERGIRPVHPAVLMEAAGHDDPRNAFSLCGHRSLPVAPRRWAPCSPPLEQMRLRARRSSRSAAAGSPWTAPT